MPAQGNIHNSDMEPFRTGNGHIAGQVYSRCRDVHCMLTDRQNTLDYETTFGVCHHDLAQCSNPGICG